MSQNRELMVRQPWPARVLAVLGLLFAITGFIWYVKNLFGITWIGLLFTWVSFLILFLLGLRRYQMTKQRLHLWIFWIYAFAILTVPCVVFDSWSTWRTHQ